MQSRVSFSILEKQTIQMLRLKVKMMPNETTIEKRRRSTKNVQSLRKHCFYRPYFA